MFRFSYLNVLTVLLLTVYLNLLHSEIEQIRIKWNSSVCQESCLRKLENQFQSLPELTGMTINGNEGEAILTWKPDAPFSYIPIEVAISRIGFGIDEIQMTIKGKISHERGNPILISSGDNTRFNLLGTPEIKPNRYIEQNSPFNRPLTLEMNSILKDAESNKKVLTISGPLFQPENSPPLYLIVESIR